MLLDLLYDELGDVHLIFYLHFVHFAAVTDVLLRGTFSRLYLG